MDAEVRFLGFLVFFLGGGLGPGGRWVKNRGEGDEGRGRVEGEKGRRTACANL